MLCSHSSTTGHGGKQLTVEWNDNGQAPRRRDWGRVNIFLATGSQNVQYKLQTLDTNVDYNAGQGSYHIDPTVGPTGGYYFLRLEGTNTTTHSVPAMAFSARFRLEDMTGTFNSTVMATVQGTSGTAQLSATSASASSTPSAPAVSSAPASTPVTLATIAPAPSASANTSQISVKSVSGAQVANKMVGYVSALVGFAAVGAAFL